VSRVCFVSYEIHPSTWGGCGVLLHHAAQLLLERGHEVVFLLDIPRHEFERFDKRDRLALPHAERCRAYLVEDLCRGLRLSRAEVPNEFQWKALRFAHALARLGERERCDWIEFFEYCGVGYYAMVERLFGRGSETGVLGLRLHNSLELIDRHEATKTVDRTRYEMYGLEHGAIELAEAVLSPTRTYYEEYYRDLYALGPERVAISQSPRLDFPVVERPSGAGEFGILYFGRVFQFKGVEQFVKAGVLLLKRRPELRCCFEIVGQCTGESPVGGRYESYLRGLVPAELRDRFRFRGHRTHEQLAELLPQVLFGVFPNLFESFCYALHEVYDAGVPVVVNDLPGFRDFFYHEKNALVYDGSTSGLLHAMERMIDDGGLRERLAKPHAVATEPLGDFYDAPRALAPLRPPPGPRALRTVVVVLNESGAGEEEATLTSLAAQTSQEYELYRLWPAEPGAPGAFAWLGRAWTATGWDDRPVSPLELETRDALVVLRGGDVLDARWLERCAGVLRRRARLAFTGTWHRAGERVEPAFLDLAPEAWPFWKGAALTRALVRTDPDQLLVDLFDPNLGALGEIGHVWKACARFGRGVLLPEPWRTSPPEERRPAEAPRLAYLVARHGEAFGPRLALLGAMTQADYLQKLAALEPGRPEQPQLAPQCLADAEQARLAVAASLGGRTLAALLWDRLRSRLGTVFR
jgi:glycosyltransferase involved in cell wall biosynthesis